MKLSDMTHEQLFDLYTKLSASRDDFMRLALDLGDWSQDLLQEALWLDSVYNIVREALYNSCASDKLSCS